MLEAGADIDQRNTLGNTALIEATIGNRRDVVRLLLESGADAGLRNRDRLTARAIAMQHKSDELIEEFDTHAKTTRVFLGSLISRSCKLAGPNSFT